MKPKIAQTTPTATTTSSKRGATKGVAGPQEVTLKRRLEAEVVNVEVVVVVVVVEQVS